jgi:hypothetical protein
MFRLIKTTPEAPVPAIVGPRLVQPHTDENWYLTDGKGNLVTEEKKFLVGGDRAQGYYFAFHEAEQTIWMNQKLINSYANTSANSFGFSARGEELKCSDIGFRFSDFAISEDMTVAMKRVTLRRQGSAGRVDVTDVPNDCGATAKEIGGFSRAKGVAKFGTEGDPSESGYEIVNNLLKKILDTSIPLEVFGRIRHMDFLRDVSKKEEGRQDGNEPFGPNAERKIRFTQTFDRYNVGFTAYPEKPGELMIIAPSLPQSGGWAHHFGLVLAVVRDCYLTIEGLPVLDNKDVRIKPTYVLYHKEKTFQETHQDQFGGQLA